jgi:hypothetical protein
MAQWPGYSTLKEGSHAEIGFMDIVHVYDCFTPEHGKSITASNSWGEEIEQICKQVGPGNQRAERRWKLRELARVLVRLLEALCMREATGAPHLQAAAEIWNPPPCPVTCRNTDVLNVFQGYPKARLGVCLLAGSPPYTVEVGLHRLACWMARGEPGDSTPFACHSCGTPQCVRLPCLGWGNHSTNQQDAYSKPARRPRRWEPACKELPERRWCWRVGRGGAWNAM